MVSRSTVFGVGINDADYVTSPKINGKQVHCPIYNSWKAMLTRCYSKKYQSKEPTYEGCTVSDDWLVFSRFRNWVLSQNHFGLHLDKDILIFGNKQYANDRCVYVPRFVNNCFRSPVNGKHSNGLPLGVSAPSKMAESPRPYMACISSPTKKSHHLGHFATANEAHAAWQKVKIEKIIMTAAEYRDHEACRVDVLESIYARAEIMKNSLGNGLLTVTI